MDETFEMMQSCLNDNSTKGEKENKFVRNTKFDVEFFKKIAPRCFTYVEGSAWTLDLKQIDIDTLNELICFGLFKNVYTPFKTIQRVTADRKLLFNLFEEHNVDKMYANHIVCHKNNKYSVKISHLSLPKIFKLIEVMYGMN